MTHYDVVVVGAGSGNSVADARFSHLRVAMVERGRWGGTCLNRGCIPSKMILHPADVAREAVEGPRLGVHTSYDGVDWPAVRSRVFGRLDHVTEQGQEYREGQDFVDVLTGSCRFTGERELEVELNAGGTVTITADHVVLAAGSEPVLPDVPGLHDVPHHTSDTVMRIETLPRRMLVMGGGYVGSELAHAFSTYGVQVTQVDTADRLLTIEDAEVSRVFTDAVSKRWDVRLETRAESVTGGDTGAVVHLSDGSEVEVDLVLVATGRKPSSEGLDLAKAGVEVDDRGRVVVDEHQRTTADGVWALGDLSSPEPLKHVANQDARVVQANLLRALGVTDGELAVSDHRFVPHAVFAEPQVASVGLTEEAAREQGLDVAVGRQAYGDVAQGWALREDDTDDFVKVLVDRATERIVGAHLVGPQASVLVQILIQAMSSDQSVRGLARGQYWIHPALTEVVENALLKVEEELDA